MTDTGRMVPAIEGVRAGRPWVEFWGDWLYRIDVPERAFALPLGDMGSVYFFTVLTWGRGDFFCPPCVRWLGLLVIVLALRPLLLILGI